MKILALLLHGGTHFVVTGSLHGQEVNVLHTNDMECIGSLTCNNTQVQKIARFVCTKHCSLP